MTGLPASVSRLNLTAEHTAVAARIPELPTLDVFRLDARTGASYECAEKTTARPHGRHVRQLEGTAFTRMMLTDVVCSAGAGFI